jgi:CubicO group peptidase (beta-lactamase class C family)
LSDEEFANNYFAGGSGYHWRVDNVVTPDGKKYQSYEATGNGGQIVLVILELDITAVFTGGNYRMGYIWGRCVMRLSVVTLSLQ